MIDKKNICENIEDIIKSMNNNNSKNNIVVDIIGSPNSGKTTKASEIFALLKIHTKLNIELVSEYAKKMVWSGRKINTIDQFEILFKQFDKEKILYDKCDIIINDCPLLLVIFYDWFYNKPYNFNYINYYQIIDNLKKLIMKENKLNIYNFIYKMDLKNNLDNYNNVGRVHNISESITIDSEINNFLKIIFDNQNENFNNAYSTYNINDFKNIKQFPNSNYEKLKNLNENFVKLI